MGEERLESGLYSRSYLENQMAVAMGGRIAEELIFGADNVTTGASGDFMQVSRTAKQMVTQVGFSDKLGQVAYGGGGGPSFLGQQMGQSSDFFRQDGRPHRRGGQDPRRAGLPPGQGPHAEQHARPARPGRPPAREGERGRGR